MPTEDIAHALVAVAQVINSWENQVRKTAGEWSDHLELQCKWSAEGDHRWAQLDCRLDRLESQLMQLKDSLGEQKESLEAGQKHIHFELERALDSATGAMNDFAKRVGEEETQAVVNKVEEGHEIIKRHVTELVSGTMEITDDGQKSIGHQMGLCNEGLGALKASFQEFHTITGDFRRHSQEAKAELARTQKQLEESLEEAHRLDGANADLRSQLQLVQQDLHRATHAPAADVLRRLKALEEKGNLRIDRQSGKVELLAPIAFQPANPKEGPSGGLLDEDGAAAALADVQELSSLFRVPMVLDVQLLPGKGGKPDFWQQVAVCQATSLKELLGAMGMSRDLLEVSGQLAAKGAKSSVITLQLQQEIFPAEIITDEKARGKSPGSKKAK